MDTITHALSGALLAMATAPGASPPEAPGRRARMAAGAAAAAFPDSDVVLRAIDTLTYLNLHQGVTHSLILLPAWAWLLALLFATLSRQRYRWPAFYGVAALGIGIHIGGDLVTAYGTQIFAPVSETRFSWPLLFVIDPWITAILVIGLALGNRWRQRQAAWLAVGALAGYLGFAATQQQRAIGLGEELARARNLDGAVTHALAQPLSPFHWLVIVQHGDRYHTARINLARDRHETRADATNFLARLADGYVAAAAVAWTRRTRFGETPAEMALARAAFAHDTFAGFRRFARFLALDHIETRGDGRCVWFSDLRFSLPELPPSFRYGLCRDGNDPDWRLARLRGAFTID